jgi:hypothetical protein
MKKSKKILSYILILLLMPIVPIEFSSAMLEWEVFMSEVNEDIKNIYGVDNYFSELNDVGLGLNKNIVMGEWGGLRTGSHRSDVEIGRAFVYGEPFGYEPTKPDPKFRYAGKTMKYNNDFTNFYHKYDSMNYDIKFEDRFWIKDPWEKISGVIINNEFNYIKFNNTPSMTANNNYYINKVRESLIEGLKMGSGDHLDATKSLLTNGTLKSHPSGTYHDVLEYVHIYQPPTYHSAGIGRMWHWSNETNSPWYWTVFFAPFSQLSQETSIIPKIAVQKDELVVVDDTLIVQENLSFLLSPLPSKLQNEETPIYIEWERRTFDNGIWTNWNTLEYSDILPSWSEAKQQDLSISIPAQTSQVGRYLQYKLNLKYLNSDVSHSKIINIKIVKLNSQLYIEPGYAYYDGESDISAIQSIHADVVGHTSPNFSKWEFGRSGEESAEEKEENIFRVNSKIAFPNF